MKLHYIIPIVLFLSSCAGYSVKSSDGQHYPVYRPQPYLLVEKDTAKVIYLPDYSKAYEIKSWSFMGKADFEFHISDGWQLTKIADKSSGEEVLKSLSGIAKDAMGMLGGRGAPSEAGGGFQLYRINIDDKTGLAGLERIKEN